MSGHSLTPDQKKWLDWLRERGGEGVVDRYGRVLAQGERSPTGAQVAWLHLVAKGWITGIGGRIRVSPFGDVMKSLLDDRHSALAIDKEE